MKRLLSILTILLAGTAVSADQIVLKPIAKTDGPVRLKDVADLYGPEAQRMAEAVVAPAGVTALTMDRVRDALAPHGPRWAELIFKGAMKVQLKTEIAKTKPSKLESKSGENKSADGKTSASYFKRGQKPAALDTVRQQIEQWILHNVGNEHDRLKIEFAASDHPLLAHRVGQGRLDLNPMGQNRLGRMPMTVRVYEQDRLVAQGRVVCQVHAERNVVVAIRSLQRGHTVVPSDVRLEKRWINASHLKPIKDVQAVMGQRVDRHKHGGSVLEVSDLRASVVVRRGQLVTLKCFSGPLVIQTTARAMEHGQLNQFISVRNEKSKQQVRGRITGPHEVTVVSGNAEPKSNSKDRS